jgi:hypothetical protein
VVDRRLANASGAHRGSILAAECHGTTRLPAVSHVNRCQPVASGVPLCLISRFTRQRSWVRVPYRPPVVRITTFPQVRRHFPCPVAQVCSSLLSNPDCGRAWDSLPRWGSAHTRADLGGLSTCFRKRSVCRSVRVSRSRRLDLVLRLGDRSCELGDRFAESRDDAWPRVVVQNPRALRCGALASGTDIGRDFA